MSNKKSISKKEVLKIISQGIENGSTKTEIFTRLSSEYSDSDVLAKLTASFPDAELKSRYNGINTVLFILLILTALLKVVGVLPLLIDTPVIGFIILLIVPILNIVLAFEVKKTRGYIYRILGMLAIAGLCKSLGQIGVLGAWVFIDVVLLGLISGISFYIGNKMFPNYGFMGPKKDEYGNWIL